MRCPWMHGKDIKHCAAVKGLVVVSISELEAYCESENYEACPVFRECKKIGHSVLLNEYYAIFLESRGKLTTELRKSLRNKVACL